MARTLALAAALLALAAPAAHAQLTWRATGALNVGRSNHTATSLRDGSVLVAGGLVRGQPGQGFPPAPSAEVYDPRTERWHITGSMAIARSRHTASRLEGAPCAGGSAPAWCGRVLLAGGAPSTVAELYEPVSRRFAPTGSLAIPRLGHTATVLRDGRVLVVGGHGVASNGALQDPVASAELYDPATGQWTSTPAPPVEARANHTATLLADGRVLVAGGLAPGFTSVVEAAEIYDPAANSWAPAGSMVVPRQDHTATVLGDGRVLFVGGQDSFGAVRRTSEIYDPAAGGRWLYAGPMVRGRMRHTATLMADGRVVVAGGIGVGATGSLVEFDATELFVHGTWVDWLRLLNRRQRHTATLLQGSACAPNCGRVLIAGGIRAGPQLIAAAELLAPVAYPAPPSGRVTDLSARALSARRVRLTFSAPAWPPRAGPARRYLVKQARRPLTSTGFERARSLCGGICSFAPGRTGDRISLTVTGLVPNRRYYYGVAPLGLAGGRGPTSNFVGVRTRRDRIRPGKVRALSARALSRRVVRLRFRAVASDGRRGPPVRRYVIKQSSLPIRGRRRFREARTLCRRTCRFSPRRVGARLTLTVRGLCPGRRLFYAIRAKDEGGNLGRVSRSRAVRTKRGPGRCVN